MIAAHGDAAVRRFLEDGLVEHLGRRVRVLQLERHALAHQSTHPIERVTVTLDSGEELRLIFKQLPAVLLDPAGAQLPKGGRREVMIYRRLLKGGQFDAPLLYASECDDATGQYWLALEDVGDTTLAEGDMDAWFAAFRGLARLHAAYFGREHELRSLGCLTEQDAAYFRGIARAARHNIRLAAGDGAVSRFDAIMSRFDSVIDFLTCAQPHTLVHGDIFVCNLMLQRDGRVRPIDWESAAVGVPALDVSLLLHGWGADTPHLLDAYFSEFNRCSPFCLDRQEFRRVLAHCRVVRALWHAGWSEPPRPDPVFADGSLQAIEAAWQRLDSDDFDHG